MAQETESGNPKYVAKWVELEGNGADAWTTTDGEQKIVVSLESTSMGAIVVYKISTQCLDYNVETDMYVPIPGSWLTEMWIYGTNTGSVTECDGYRDELRVEPNVVRQRERFYGLPKELQGYLIRNLIKNDLVRNDQKHETSGFHAFLNTYHPSAFIASNTLTNPPMFAPFT